MSPPTAGFAEPTRAHRRRCALDASVALCVPDVQRDGVLVISVCLGEIRSKAGIGEPRCCLSGVHGSAGKLTMMALSLQTNAPGKALPLRR